MDFFVGITDEAWFRFHAARKPDEVNFWRPRDQNRFRAIPKGSPFLFKLKGQANAIVGAATYQEDPLLPVPVAWDFFEQENGAPDRQSFIANLGRLASETEREMIDRFVRCIILSEPVFFDEADWIPTPTDWAGNIVQGRRYSTLEPHGNALWQAVQVRLTELGRVKKATTVRAPQQLSLNVYGEPALVKRRLGQGLFRYLTLENYAGTCCVTGETTAPAIEAAHILPIAKGGEHRLDNGLALRADMHLLFDRGLISVDPEYRIHVSSRIKQLYHNGVVYYKHEGELLRSLPDQPENRPNRELLDWHFREEFIA